MDKDSSGTQDTLKKIEESIDTQKPAVEDSEWAEAPEFNELTTEELAAIREQSAAAAEYADAEGEEGSTPEPAEVSESDKQDKNETPPAEEKVPAGEAAAQKSEGGKEEPQFDTELVTAAGLRSVDEAKELFGTPKALEAAVRLMDQRSILVASEQQRYVAPAQPTTQTQSKIPDVSDPGDFKMPDPPEGEEWDDATVAVVKSLHAHFDAKFKAQQESLQKQQEVTEQFVQDRQSQELRRYIDEFDGFVEQLGDDWKATFGKGSGFELDPKGIHLQNRVVLDQASKNLATGRKAQGLPELSQPELLKRALRVAFPQQQETEIRKKVTEEVVNRQKLITPRPGGKVSKPQHKTGEAAAAGFAERWYAERGMASAPFDDVDPDGI